MRATEGRRDVLPLAFHVTYWDRLGWKDPFSLEAATERQDRYGHRFGDGSYTPEIVVDGAKSYVGSHRQEVGSAIERAKNDSRTVANINVTKDGGRVSIEIGSGSGSGRVLLIGFDHDHRTAIGRGENAGRTLDEVNVVRSIRSVGDWSGAGPAIVKAELVHQNLNLLRVPRLSRDVLTAAGLDDAALASIFAILDSCQHTNALALCASPHCLLALKGSARRPDLWSAPQRDEVGSIRRVALPRLVPIAEMPPATARLVHELNGFGEDSDFALVASMYRHLSHWPTYLALIRTLLAPLHESGKLKSLVAEARILGWEHGRDLASDIPLTSPPQEVESVLAAVRRFVRHPIARMTGVCSLVRRAMDESESQPVRG